MTPSPQMALTLRPPRAAKPPRWQTVDPSLRSALGVLLHGRHHGRDHAATWEALRLELEACGIRVNHVRRLQEAVSALRRLDKMPIGSTSSDGVFFIADDSDRKLAAAERVKRIRSEAEELAAFDRALYEQIAGVLRAVEGATP